ncbi:lactate utilization protein C [Bacillus sp. FJAT-29814]|uniref:LutC/YkgG family protein n=1 Tax=Bacillus sp. FJAT-29814 TaxID=1729688 RepID=UPI00082F6BCC|nr:lactate utilization protein C [Bacillus sp. FJAT-29814]
MTGTIQNRDKFLNHIARRLERERISAPLKRPEWRFRPQNEVLKHASQDELVEVFKEQCQKTHTSLLETDSQNFPATLKEVVAGYDGGPIVTWKDDRFLKWGLASTFHQEWPNQGIEFFEWDYAKGIENIAITEKANVGIVISEITLAESGTVVLFSDKNKGRTVSFLPQALIAIVPKSTLVPRMTQAAQKMRTIYHQEGHVSPCINFITGPSNSADIELNLVVGVHGPVKTTYILITNL